MANSLEQNLQMSESLEKQGIDPFDAPVPGESLTTDSSNPRPYEQPPRFTNVESAMDFIFDQLTEDENYEQLLNLMRDGVPIADIAQVYLTKGFHEGEWNPDLFLLLVEPTIYLLMWLANSVEIDFVLDGEPDPEEEDERDRQLAQQKIKELKANTPSSKEIESKVPSSLLGKMEEFKGEV